MLKRPLILAFCLLTLFDLLSLVLRAESKGQGASTPVTDDLSRLLEAAIDARKSGDPAAINRASQQVIALGLAQMAKLRLDQKEYEDAAKLCQESLEFADIAETRVEIAIVNLYAKKSSDAVKQATTATEMDPQNPLAWTIKGEALLRSEDYTGAATALTRAVELRQDAEPLYALAMAQLGAGEKERAAESFSQMLALVGDYGWSRVLVGRGYQQQKMPQEAIVEFQNALRLDPRTPDAHYFWARTLLQANAWSPTPEIRSQLEEELKLNPRHFLANYLLGIFSSIERNYDESNRYLHLAAEINPSWPEIWMYLGLNANARNASGSAEAYLRKAINLRERGNPKEHLSVRQAYFVLGRILLASGRKQEGEHLIKKAQELTHLLEAHENRVTAKANNETRVAEALAPDISETDDRNAFIVRPGQAPIDERDLHPERRSAAKSPRDPAGRAEAPLRTILGSSFNDLATAEALEEKYDLALKHYREAATWDSRIPGLHRNLGLALFFTGQPGEAIRLLRKVVTETPGDAHARAVLGLAYVAAKDFAKAAQTIAPIAGRAAQDPQLGIAWAKSLAETGNKKAAVRALQRLDNLATNLSIENLIQSGKLWQELGEPDRATQFFRRALIIDPTNADAKCALHLTKCP
ncbi:MAG: hypothetical protein DMG48_16060 [Acidobacteria bacterium]|nr:MAG: hypothetical protein DMG48_16060 [Acidobacteriota bacterium]